MTAMTEQMTAETRFGRTVSHGTFTLERTFPMPRRTVFAAWAAKESKNEWFGEGDDFLESVDEYSLDFRTGGREHLAGVLGGSGNHFVYDALYGDIVDGERIV